MMIFLGIIGELATVVGTLVITTNAGIDAVLEIPKNGYKIDKDTYENWRKKQAETKKEITTLQKWKSLLLFLFPGVNLVNATIKGIRLKRSIMKDPQIQEALIPMTPEEKELYSKMKGRFQKAMCATFSITKENEEEFMGFVGNHPIVVDHGLISIYHERLLPLAYTLDEVKRLNEATTYSYRIGKVDGRNVAIIGIPNANKSVCRVEFKREDKGTTHTYEPMSEQEAENKTFIVYPFSNDHEEEVEKVIKEIKEARTCQATTANLEALQLHNEVLNDTRSKESCGPVLKKTLF